jgi:hypothetical protein
MRKQFEVEWSVVVSMAPHLCCAGSTCFTLCGKHVFHNTPGEHSNMLPGHGYIIKITQNKVS